MSINKQILKALNEAKEEYPSDWKVRAGVVKFAKNVSPKDLKSFVENGELTLDFKEVEYLFDCSGLGLTSTKGFPSKFTVLDCSNNKLKSLPITATEFKKGNGVQIYCQENQLTTLRNIKINCKVLELDCSDNKLKSIDGLEVNGIDYINCADNPADFDEEVIKRLYDLDDVNV